MGKFFTKADRQKVLAAGYKYQPSPSEIEEVKWLVKEGDFSSVEQYIESVTSDHIKIARKEQAAERRKARNGVRR